MLCTYYISITTHSHHISTMWIWVFIFDLLQYCNKNQKKQNKKNVMKNTYF